MSGYEWKHLWRCGDLLLFKRAFSAGLWNKATLTAAKHRYRSSQVAFAGTRFMYTAYLSVWNILCVCYHMNVCIYMYPYKCRHWNCRYIAHTPPLTMVKETVHRTSSFFPSLQFFLWDPWGEKVRWGQRRKEGSSLSPINIISMGAQNVLCQQNTDLLSREEHENERERWEEWKGRERYYHSILQVCDLYGTPYISLISKNAVKMYERHWAWVKKLNL